MSTPTSRQFHFNDSFFAVSSFVWQLSLSQYFFYIDIPMYLNDLSVILIRWKVEILFLF